MSLKKRVERLLERAKRVRARKIRFPEDPEEFFVNHLGLEPYKYQLRLARKFMEHRFVAARWCRQSGKSSTIAALLLHYALTHKGSNIGVVSPSFRQSKEIIKKINAFLQKLPRGVYYEPQKTLVRLANGSLIQAFPNNPETIRGPTFHMAYCDEMNFVANDRELYDAILFTLVATDGKFICSSTPWKTDSVFHRIFNHPDYKGEFAHSHVTWREALGPKGSLKRKTAMKIKRQLRGDPWRWRREMEAKWAEDENVWLNQDLIARCIGTPRTLGYDLEYYGFEDHVQGEFYLGADFGKHRDHSVIAVAEWVQNQLLLRHCHQFKLKTPYSTVIGHIKVLCDRWTWVHRSYLDKTGLGEYIVEDIKNTGVQGVEGVNLTDQRKEEIATALKQAMIDGRFWFPFDDNLINELNVERFELTKTGRIKLSHPEGTHDDRFWAVALAVYAATVGRKSKPSRPMAVSF